MIDYILNPQSVEALGWTLLHSLWQGAAFAILLVVILIALRSYSAQSRYVVSVGLLCAFFLTLSGTFWFQWQEANVQFELAAQQLDRSSTTDAFTLNDSGEALLPTTESKLPLNREIVIADQSSWLITFRDYYQRHLPLLVTIWLLGVLFLQLRFFGQLAYVQRLKHYGTQFFPSSWNDKIEELEGKLRIQKKVGYLTSMRIQSPMVIGWLKPVVLLPRQLLNNLSETEIYAVLAHELAHIRREDFIVNLLQTFLCNVFFFHPGVWWMSNRIDDEREHCCDDLAVAATGPATSYAKTLINVSEFQLNRQGNPQLAMALSGKSKKRERGGFSSRIRRLFVAGHGVGSHSSSYREGFATAIILITALFLGVAATGSTIQDIDSSTTSEIKATGDTSNNDQSNIIEPTQSDANQKINENRNALANQKSEQLVLPIEIEKDIEEPEAQAETATPVETRIDALVMACEEGDLDFVKTLVNSGIEINGIGSNGITPLMMASSKEESEIVQYLLTQGADVNQSYNNWTALIEAADEGSLKSMTYLLKAGADVNYYESPGSPTAISMAASEGHLDCLKLLLEYGADINGAGKSMPPLHIAAQEGNRAIIDFIISKNANINKQDVLGRTALMHAASEGKKTTVRILIEAGADISIVDIYDDTARDYADKAEQYSTREYLDYQDYGNDDIRDLSSTEDRPKIHQATIDGYIEKVQAMVERGTDINSKDDYGRTPLHIASALGHNIDMRVLIDLGADLDAQDNQDRTPLMYAAADGKENAAALLVSKLADVNIKDVDGMRAYEWGQSGGNSDLAKFLGLITEKKQASREKDGAKAQRKKTLKDKERARKIQQKIQNDIDNNKYINTKTNNDINTNVNTNSNTGYKRNSTRNLDKRESFHVASDGVHLRQFDIEEGIPLLLEAARHGSVADCAKLIDDGLSVNTTDDTGQTALMVAARTNRIKVAAFLIEEGADVNMSSASGLTALHYAALENNDQIARLLLENNANVDAIMRYSSTDGNYGKEPLVWEYIGATPLLIAVEAGRTEVTSVLIEAGANKNKIITRNEYRLNKNRESYLSGGEVMGLDEDFLKEVKVRKSDETWTPYKHALLLNKPEILAFFQK